MPFGTRLVRVKNMRGCFSLFVFLGNRGYETLRGSGSFVLKKLLPKNTFSPEHNTLPDLARVFESFSQLEKVDMETEHHQLISFLPSPIETAMVLSPLLERGVEINVLLRKWQLRQWASVCKRNGMDMARLRFWHENGGEVGLAYEGKTGGGMLSYGLVRYRISDCLEGRSEALGAK
jgi:hypothetical protein